MKNIQTFCTTLIVLACLLTAKSNAQQSHEMARFLDSNTIAFARLDLESFDPEFIHERFLSFAKREQLLQAGESIMTLALNTKEKLANAGASEVFAFLSLNDLSSGPFYVLPCENENYAELSTFVDDIAKIAPELSVSQIPEGVLVASKHTKKRLEDKFLSVREDATEILKLAVNTFDFVLAPSKDQLKAIRESIGPPFPKYAGTVFTEGGITGELLADGMQRTVFSIRNSPLSIELKVTGISQAPSGQEDRLNANAKLAAKAGWLLGQLQEGRIPYWPRAHEVGEFSDQLISALTQVEITQSGNQFSIYIGDHNDRQLSILADAVTSMLYDQVFESFAYNHRLKSVRQIVLAIHNYHSALQNFPTGDIVDEDGNPLLSWRVNILPYMGEKEIELYEKFDLDQAWNSDHNLKLLKEIPTIYQTDQALTLEGKTVWTIPKGEGFIGNCPSIREVLDGTSNTIMALGVAPENAMNWTEPTDLEPDLNDIKRGIFSDSQSTLVLGRADGSTDSFPDTMSKNVLIALLTYAGGEVVPDGNE